MEVVRVGLAAAMVIAPVAFAQSAEAGRTWTKDMGRTWAKSLHNEVKCIPHGEKSHMVKVVDSPAVEEKSHMIKVVDVEAQAAVEEVWANFSPNHHQGPFVGPPSWPSDSRGTWHLHKHIPKGHAGPDGVYERDHNGKKKDGDWFYRLNGKAAVEEKSHMEKVVDVEAKPEKSHMVKVVDSKAVTCAPKPTVNPTPAPKPKPHATHKPVPDKTESLPHTGATENGLMALAGIGLVGSGIVLRRKFN